MQICVKMKLNGYRCTDKSFALLFIMIEIRITLLNYQLKLLKNKTKCVQILYLIYLNIIEQKREENKLFTIIKVQI